MVLRLNHEIPGMRIDVVNQRRPAYYRWDISGCRARWLAKSPNPIWPQVAFTLRIAVQDVGFGVVVAFLNSVLIVCALNRRIADPVDIKGIIGISSKT